MRLGELPLELIVQAEGRLNATVSRGLDEGSQIQQVRGASGRGGLRLSLPLVSRWGVHASATAGVQYVHGSVKLDWAVDDVSETREVWTPAFAGSAGLSYAMGPGRLMLDLQWVHAPMSGFIRGNFGGLGANVGYVLELGGRAP